LTCDRRSSGLDTDRRRRARGWLLSSVDTSNTHLPRQPAVRTGVSFVLKSRGLGPFLFPISPLRPLSSPHNLLPSFIPSHILFYSLDPLLFRQIANPATESERSMPDCTTLCLSYYTVTPSWFRAPSLQENIYLLSTNLWCVAQWLGRRSLAGGLSLPRVRSMFDR